uniref:Heat shock protein family A (Hsp70) member 4 like n=1 Tax=Molossus molossus TaxID=27622 RepID=A0A7J8I7S0_MOLMO|nr:heat shock protein family A (Hsp70) member 4 like [Molossus molossus]
MLLWRQRLHLRTKAKMMWIRCRLTKKMVIKNAMLSTPQKKKLIIQEPKQSQPPRKNKTD